MTATTAVGIPMIAGTAAAVLVAELTNAPPIYDSLRERMSPDLRRRSSGPGDSVGDRG